MTHLKSTFLVLIIIFFKCCNFHSISIPDNYNKADAIVVLGFQLDKDGSSFFIQDNRVAMASYLYKNKIAPKVILTGGNPVRGTTEAAQMKRLAIEFGIKAKDIILEDKAGTTLTNAINTIKIANKLKFKSIVLVSDYNHLKYAVSFFKLLTDDIDIYWCSTNYKLLAKLNLITYPTKIEYKKFKYILYGTSLKILKFRENKLVRR